jgi:hypothetical protein
MLRIGHHFCLVKPLMVKLDIIYHDAIPEKQYILKIMGKQEDLLHLKKVICIL